MNQHAKKFFEDNPHAKYFYVSHNHRFPNPNLFHRPGWESDPWPAHSYHNGVG